MTFGLKAFSVKCFLKNIFIYFILWVTQLCCIDWGNQWWCHYTVKMLYLRITAPHGISRTITVKTFTVSPNRSSRMPSLIYWVLAKLFYKRSEKEHKKKPWYFLVIIKAKNMCIYVCMYLLICVPRWNIQHWPEEGQRTETNQKLLTSSQLKKHIDPMLIIYTCAKCCIWCIVYLFIYF